MTAVERARAAAARHKRDFDPRQAMPLCTAFIDDIRAEEAGKIVRWGAPISTGRGIVPLTGGWPAAASDRPNPARAERPAAKPASAVLL